MFQLECADPPPQAAVRDNITVPDTLDHDHALCDTTLTLIDNPHGHAVPMRYLQRFQNNIHRLGLVFGHCFIISHKKYFLYSVSTKKVLSSQGFTRFFDKIY